jgi:predicted RNA-binding Zn ribbon-like protein
VSREIEQKPSSGAEAALLVDYVNTRDVEEETDAIANSSALAAWIGANVPDLDELAIDADGHRRALALREALRELLRANNGGDPRPDLLEPLRDAVARSAYRARMAPGGKLVLEPADDGLGAFEARLLLAVERLQAAGEWPRLKACPGRGCEWAFYDTSRNRSRTWCSMEECGNRAKTRRYRSRRKNPR